MGYKKDVKAYYKELREVERLKKKEEQKVEREHKSILLEAKALANKLEKMNVTEYDKFINSVIEDVLVREAEIKDLKEKSTKITSSISRGKLTDRQVNVIVLAHCLSLAMAGTIIAGWGFAPNMEDQEVLVTLLGTSIGGMSGLFTSFFHYLAKDENSLSNFFKECKTKVINKKINRKQKSLDKDMSVLKEFDEPLSENYVYECKYNMDAHNAHKEITDGLEKMRVKIASKVCEEEMENE